jgi:aminotransferase in exopolysaccharide biosynthesis
MTAFFMSDRVALHEPALLGNARAYLEECLHSNFVSSVGPFVERFEREFAAYVGSAHAVACASGTAAIHVALRLLGVGPGDEVFVPTLTFVASANPVVYQGATPVFIDAEPETWNIDPGLVAEELDRRRRSGKKLPKVVEVVHVLGHPAQIAPIVEACERHGVAWIEDAAEALGARYVQGPYAGRHVGTIGKLGCFSFNGNKILTTGGGGMIVTDDETLARRAKHLTTQARLSGPEYQHDEIGYNYRMTNLAAALGVAQLEQLPTFLERKRQIAAVYDRALTGMVGFSAPPRAEWASPSFWLYSIGVDPGRSGIDRQGLWQELASRGIESRPIWSPLHCLPMYRQAPCVGGEIAIRLHDRGLSLPCSVGLTDGQQARVVSALTSHLDADRAVT